MRARLPLLWFALYLVVREMAPPVLTLLGAIDTGSAIWTALALRQERKSLPSRANAPFGKR